MKSINHILYWVISSILLIVLFGKPYGGYIISFYFVSFLLPIIIGTSYLFNSYLVPNFLLKRNYFKFGQYTLYTIIISLNLEILVILLAFAVLANYDYEQMVPASKNIFGLAISMYFVVIVKAFILLAKSSFLRLEKIQALEEKQSNLQKGYLVVRSDRKNVKVLLEELFYLESLSDYVKLITSSGETIITKEKISVLEEKLTTPFIRIHRSFIINADKIDSFTAEDVEINGDTLPISRTYKKAAREVLGNKKV